MIEKFEPLCEPYDRFTVSNMGYVLDRDTGLTVTPDIDMNNGRPYVVLEGSHNKTRKFFLCTLVTDNFLQNPHNLGYIYYKDGDVENTHVSNLGYAINPHEGKQRNSRPLRRKVEAQRHQLIVDIGKCLDYNDYLTAERLGRQLWELEGHSWLKRNTPEQY